MPADWVGDPSITWRILLVARPLRPVAPALLGDRLAALHAAQGWTPPAPVRRGADVDRLAAELAEVEGSPVAVGVAGPDLVVSAHHSQVDGLGLLDVVAALLDSPVSSSSRGLADHRPTGGAGLAALRRLGEVALAPPATIARPPVAARPGDVLVRAALEGPVRTAALVHAGAGAVVDHNGAAHRRTRHVAVAIGAARRAEPHDPITNRSELLRLRDVERLSLAEVEALVGSVPADGAGGAGPGGGAVMRTALRVLAPRLGSTLLVSHLGAVAAPALEAPAFYPVTAGGSGVSLGAVGHDGRTTLTLRARATQWDEAGLGALLGAIVDRL